jgi:hypothetical protein
MRLVAYGAPEEVSPCRGAFQEVRGSRILRGLEKGRRRAEHAFRRKRGARCVARRLWRELPTRLPVPYI